MVLYMLHRTMETGCLVSCQLAQRAAQARVNSASLAHQNQQQTEH